jgi:hypothetical protein
MLTTFKLTRNFVKVVCALCLSFVFDSCTYDNFEQPTPKNDQAVILSAKTFFDHWITTQPALSTERNGNYRKFLPRELDWSDAKVVQLSSGDAVTIPIKFAEPYYVKAGEDGRSIPIKNLTYLQIRTDLNNGKVVEIVTYIPGNLGDDKNGLSIIEDWSGDFKKAYRYKNGQPVAIQVANRQNETARSKWVECVIVDWYTCTAWDGHWQCSYDYSEFDCNGGGDGGPYGGGDGTDGGDYGGGYGGDGDAGDCIYNQLVTPCLFNVAAHVLDPNVASTYNGLIQQAFNSSDQINWILSEGSTDGAANTPPDVIHDGIFTVTTILDPADLTNKSREYIASTIYHEAFHALMHKYTGAFTYTPSEHHYQMMTNFIIEISQALQQAYPNISAVEAKALIAKQIYEFDGAVRSQILSRIGLTEAQISAALIKFGGNGPGTTGC